jgi:hypothetical protein
MLMVGTLGVACFDRLHRLPRGPLSAYLLGDYLPRQSHYFRGLSPALGVGRYAKPSAYKFKNQFSIFKKKSKKIHFWLCRQQNPQHIVLNFFKFNLFYTIIFYFLFFYLFIFYPRHF